MAMDEDAKKQGDFLLEQLGTMMRKYPVYPLQDNPKEWYPGQGGEPSIFQDSVFSLDPMGAVHIGAAPRFMNKQTGRLLKGNPKGLDKRLWREVTYEQWKNANKTKPLQGEVPKHLLSDKNYPYSIQPKVKSYAKLPGELGKQINTLEHPGLGPSRGKGLQGHYLANETTSAKRARLIKQAKDSRIERTGFFHDAEPRKMYDGKGGEHGELNELDAENYNDFIRNITPKKGANVKKGTALPIREGGQVKRDPEPDYTYFKSALFEAMKKPDKVETGAELHKIAKGLAEGTTTLSDLKGTKWSKLKASHKRVLADGLEWLSGKYKLQKSHK